MNVSSRKLCHSKNNKKRNYANSVTDYSNNWQFDPDSDLKEKVSGKFFFFFAPRVLFEFSEINNINI